MIKLGIFFLILNVNVIFGQNFTVNKHRFPKGFLFGVGTSAFQIEGAWNEDGKTESLWDNYVHNNPTFIEDRSNGDIACDSYHKLEEDVALLKHLGVTHYRFSLSWTRILPTGFNDTINPLAIQHYKKLIKLLKYNGIIPVVTIFHWDIPQSLQNLGGFLNASAADWFADYARVCFAAFGSDVKYWATFNEPKSFCFNGYGAGVFPPQVKSAGLKDLECSHNLLRAHAKAYRLYDKEFRTLQRGQVTIVLDMVWLAPNSNSTADAQATVRGYEFELGWYANPVFWGDYPEIMKTRIASRSAAEGRNQSRLPEFTSEEKKALNGSADFFALNTYTGALIIDRENAPITNPPNHYGDAGIIPNQPASWGNSTLGWLKVAPWGVRNLLKWVQSRYRNPRIIITENGYADTGGLDDSNRLDYHKQYLSYIRDSMIEDGVKVFGYTAWSLLDNFEWAHGYIQKFGFYEVNFTDPNRTRTPKLSAGFFKHVCATRCLVEDGECLDAPEKPSGCSLRRQ